MKRFAVLGATSCMLLASTLVSCSSTSMVSHWTDPQMAGKKLGKVLVLGVAKNDGIRRQFEDGLASSIQGAKVPASASYPLLPNAGDITEEGVAAIAREQGITHIIVTRLIDKQTVQEYVPPSVTTTYAPAYPSYYGGWYGYYHTSYATVVTPGYTYETTYVSLETNVYDVATGKLVWSGVTSTELGSNAEGRIRDFIGVITGYMKQDKIL